MIQSFQQIKCLAEDCRLNTINSPEIIDYKLRQIEDICIKSIMIINQIRNENN